MNTKELKIEIPEGYEIDEEKSTLSHIIFKEIPKLDLSIINDEDWFYIESILGGKWMAKGNIINTHISRPYHYCVTDKRVYTATDASLIADTRSIKSIRKCTPEEIEKIKTIFPEAFKKQYPSKWEDLEGNDNDEWVIGLGSKLCSVDGFSGKLYHSNQWTKKEYAEAALALGQLIRLRDIYNDGVDIDWSSNTDKYCIYAFNNNIETHLYNNTHRVLAFHRREQRDLFLKNFKDLIEQAKPLL